MSRFVIVTSGAGAPATFLYNDAEKALKKVRTLERNGATFTLTDGTGASCPVSDLTALKS